MECAGATEEGGREGGKWRKRETASSFSGGLLPPSPVLPLPPSRGLEGYVMSRAAAAGANGANAAPGGNARASNAHCPATGWILSHSVSPECVCTCVHCVPASHPFHPPSLPRECVPNPGGNPPLPVKVDVAVKFGRAVSPISFTALETGVTGRRTWLRCSIAD